MGLKNLYMIQPNFLYGNTVHLPYASGALAAYVFYDEDISANYSLKKIQFLREPVESCVLQAEDPFVVGFSTYVWNFEYNKALAKKFKEVYPSCLIVFGGHHVPPGGTLLEQCPFIDILIHGEGEEPFRQVLLSYLDKVSLEDISNISFRKNGIIKTNQAEIYTHCDYPSPYLEGYFDSFFTDYPALHFELIFETNRGCPYNCAFCDWGNLKTKIRCFSLERVYRELDWASNHCIEYAICADANFGILDRDEKIIDRIIELKNKTGYPQKFQTSYAKNNSDRIYRIGKKLHDNAMNKGVTLSLQTLSEDAATNVGRANLSIEHYTELMQLYNAADIPTYTELILGLPGENYKSFAKGLDDLLNAGQHHSVYVHNCEWLPCSVMGDPDYIRKYKIETTLIPLNQPHMEHLKRGEVQEYSRIVTSTYSMDNLMWIDMSMLSYAVQCFHHMNLLQFFALYLHAEQGLGYIEFYERLLKYIMEHPDTVSGKIFKELRSNLENILKGQGSLILFDEIFGDVSWPFEEFAFLCIVRELENFYDEIEPFLRSFNIPEDLMEDLLFYQRNIIKRPGGVFAQKKLRYNLHEYFNGIFRSREVKLLRTSNFITIEDWEPLDNWADYARIIVWYGKKESKNIYTDSVTVKEYPINRKNIYFVQVGFAFDKSLYLPLAAGALTAFALQDEFVRDTYDFKDFIFRRDKLDEVISRMEDPVLIGFSCCVWNFEYNKALAKKVKLEFPNALILFGGHNIPENNDILLTEEYVDILMRGEGEEPFLDLLKALPCADFEKVPNISYRNSAGQIIDNPRRDYSNIENYPSAYTSGVFDSLLRNNPDVDFLSVLETNRGCPYNCSYCDWCAGKTVRLFPMERVKAEIAWLSENKIEYCFCADSNFGMFKRDLEIVDFIVEMKAKNGYPKVFRPCYAKNSDENVFQISKTLNSMEMDKGATLTYQTLSDEALINVNRKNLTLDKFANLLAKYNQAGIPSYSELILGLPGETYESFSSGICELLEAGQHNSISVYHCELLVNSEMAQEDYMKRHGIVTARIPFNHIHSADAEEEVQEYSNVIIATDTMSNEMWVKSNLFSVCVQCFHNLGLLRCFALYMYYENDLSYMDFYNKLLSCIKQAEGTLANRLFANFEKELKDTKTGKWMYRNPLFGEASWFFEEGAFLEFIVNYKRFWSEIIPFLEDLKLDNEVFDDLIRYQKAIIKRPGTPPQKVALLHDFSRYFDSIYSGQPEPLKKVPNIFHTAGDNDEADWAKYAKEIVWYGRRRGATLRINNKGETRTEYSDN